MRPHTEPGWVFPAADPYREQHSHFGGSGAARWLACTGSVALCAAMPPLLDTDYSREGKIAHALAAYCLTRHMRDATKLKGIKFHPWPAHKDEEFEITKQLVEAVQLYLNLCWELIDEAGAAGQWWVEVRFHLRDSEGREMPEAYGTADFVLYNRRTRKLIVIDYKHGAGIAVSVEENVQGKHYGTGAYQHFRALSNEIDDVEIIIVQPNDWRNGGDDREAVRRWTTTGVEIELFGAELEEGVAAGKRALQLFEAGASIEHLLKSGDHCSNCDAAAACPLRKREVLEHIGVESLDEITPARMADPGLLDPADLASALRAADVMREWAKQVFKAADSLVRQGTEVPGFKLVDKDSRAHWISDEEEIADYLMCVYGLDPDALRPPSLVSITEAERQLKAEISDPKEFAEAKKDLRLRFTIKESSGQKLVPSSHKGEAVNTVQKAFGDVVINLDD